MIERQTNVEVSQRVPVVLYYCVEGTAEVPKEDASVAVGTVKMSEDEE